MTDEWLDRTAEAILTAHRFVIEHGNPRMVALSRLLLMEIGSEIASREREPDCANDDARPE
ncbi:hypothetical protein MKK84_00020 [Methylobacterium sp. E-065]|uniref:hypothetical protein n=1 Tax=Methylobacterium sp. E-065 TaxID=2836583 RepID=UPI001FB86CDB|nr:hypothetical protein [Methylobacterium sp. E-065]MCJ2015825.1 hypothetical protein [Methylobacterium sp. E-065]